MLFLLFFPFFLQTLCINASIYNITDPNEVSALWDIFNEDDGQNWVWNSKGIVWDNTTDPCIDNWQGIVCNTTLFPSESAYLHITTIDLKKFNLKGSLPISINSFTYLNDLDFYDNYLSGILPELFNLTNLVNLDISSNSFTGKLINQFSNLSSIVLLSLESNSFSGSIPQSIFTLSTLQDMIFSSNFFSGQVPDLFGQLQSLVNLNLGSNHLSGTLPPSLYLPPNLISFYLSFNNFDSTLPPSYSSMSNLQSFDVSGNMITGSIPSGYGNLNQLIYFQCYDNRITGSLPPGLFQLPHLMAFAAHQNRLTGNIPDIFNPQIELFSIAANSIQGSVPASLLNKTSLIYIFADGNYLNGPLPSNLTALTSLQYFFFSSNQLTGPIPTNITELPQLIQLNLSNNQLQGKIPPFANLKNFKKLDLHNNFLTGSIPSSLSTLDNLELLSLGSNILNGLLPSNIQGMRSLQQLNLFNNKLSGTLPPGVGQLYSLTDLILGRNLFSGALPDMRNILFLRNVIIIFTRLSGPITSLFLPNIQNLILSQNFFNGTIPSSIQYCKQLVNLVLTSNMLTGQIPSEVSKITQIQTISLANNGFEGLVPDLSANVNLRRIVLSNNAFNGSLPTSLWTVPRLNLAYFDNNRFMGSLPYQLYAATQLQYLNLAHNSLYGSINKSIDHLVNLYELTLSNNLLTGSLPSLSSIKLLNTLDVSVNKLFGTLLMNLTTMEYLVTLSLSQNFFEGELPTLLNQPLLESLDLSYNQFNGTIPIEFAKSSSLLTEMYLQNNALSGQIPNSLSALYNLNDLDLSKNQFTGPIPSGLNNLSNVVSLNLMSNLLSGNIPDFSGLSSITVLNLASNQLQGTITTNLSIPSLEELHLEHNHLSGSLPSNFSQMDRLGYLYLSSNRFSGSIPSYISRMQNLYELTLSSNRLNGTIPDFLGNSVFNYISISGNSLSGSLPESVCQLHFLETLSLGFNQLNGSIPDCMNQLNELSTLLLNDNQLEGTISNNITSLPKLTTFIASNNRFWGSLPDFTSMDNLIFLDFSNNGFQGEIPASIGAMKNLTEIYLQKNNLTGPIPNEISLLTQLEVFLAFDNHLNGTLTSGISKLKSLQHLDIHSNKFSGQFPDISNLQYLQDLNINFNDFSGLFDWSWLSSQSLTGLFMASNQLEGTLPVNIGDYDRLQYLYIPNNRFFGTVPESFSKLANLYQLNMANNSFSGSLPYLEQMSLINSISLSRNRFNGNFPQYLGFLIFLKQVYLYNNELEGTIPPNLSNLEHLEIFNVMGNGLIGTLPNNLSALKLLKQFNVAQNNLYGKIPAFPTGYVLNLVDLSNNYLTGSIPADIINPNVSDFYLYLAGNRLSGPLSAIPFQAPNLKQLQLQSNQFTGRLDNVFTTTNLPNLDLLDVSDNRFTGTLPSDLLLLPSLQTLALSKNCFYGSLPSFLCDMNQVENLILNGLSASPHCKNTKFKGQLSHLMVGTLPSCLWLLPKLKSLALAGNGFTGSLNGAVSTNLMAKSMIQNVSLSHNRLSGSIPDYLTQRYLINLDLSYNFFTGQLPDINQQFLDASTDGETIHFHKNYLYGTIPSSYENAPNVELLSGNQFSCNSYYKNAPENDPGYDNYSCSNHQYLISFLVFLIPTVVVAILFGIRSYRYSKSKLIQQMRFLHLNLQHDANLSFDSQINIQYMSSTVYSIVCHFNSIRTLFLYIATFFLLVLMPLYLIFHLVSNYEFSVYQNDDLWLTTASNLTGFAPSLFFFLFWTIILFSVSYLLLRLHLDCPYSSRPQEDSETNALQFEELSTIAAISAPLDTKAITVEASLEEGMSKDKMVDVDISADSSQPQSKPPPTKQQNSLDTTLPFNTKVLQSHLIAGLVSTSFMALSLLFTGGYILLYNDYTVSTDLKSFLQFLMACIMLFMNQTILRHAMRLISLGRIEKVYIGNFLTVFNTILSPLVCVLLFDSNCFKDFFTGMNAVTASYLIPRCNGFVSINYNDQYYFNQCVDSSWDQYSTSITPAFVYNFTCNDAVLADFVPVFFYLLLVTLIIMPFFTWAFSHLQVTTFLSFQKVFQLQGILHPALLSSDPYPNDFLINFQAVEGEFVQLFSILMTFGLTSPLLAMACAIVAASEVYLNQFYIMRYIYLSTQESPFFDERFSGKIPSNQLVNTNKVVDESPNLSSNPLHARPSTKMDETTNATALDKKIRLKGILPPEKEVKNIIEERNSSLIRPQTNDMSLEMKSFDQSELKDSGISSLTDSFQSSIVPPPPPPLPPLSDGLPQTTTASDIQDQKARLHIMDLELKSQVTYGFQASYRLIWVASMLFLFIFWVDMAGQSNQGRDDIWVFITVPLVIFVGVLSFWGYLKFVEIDHHMNRPQARGI